MIKLAIGSFVLLSLLACSQSPTQAQIDECADERNHGVYTLQRWGDWSTGISVVRTKYCTGGRNGREDMILKNSGSKEYRVRAVYVGTHAEKTIWVKAVGINQSLDLELSFCESCGWHNALYFYELNGALAGFLALR